MRNIDLIVIHCAATPNGRWTSTVDIDQWHKQRGFRRGAVGLKLQNPDLKHIGYHYVLYTNGAVATGRHAAEIGAHATQHRANHVGLGVCLVGTDKFTLPQWYALRDQVAHLCAEYHVPRQFARPGNGFKGVCGHRDLSPDLDADGTIEPQEWLKTCPGFSVADWLRGGMVPMEGHIVEGA